MKLMSTLCDSDQIAEKEQILVSIVSTKLSELDSECVDYSKKKAFFNEMQFFINKFNISHKSKYCASVYMYDAILSCEIRRENTLGFDLPGNYKFPRVFEKESQKEDLYLVKMKILTNIVKNLEVSDPYHTDDEQHKQILLQSAYILTSFLPSSNTASPINRIRFLTFLVLGQLKDFQNKVRFPSIFLFLIFTLGHRFISGYD